MVSLIQKPENHSQKANFVHKNRDFAKNAENDIENDENQKIGPKRPILGKIPEEEEKLPPKPDLDESAQFLVADGQESGEIGDGSNLQKSKKGSQPRIHASPQNPL